MIPSRQADRTEIPFVVAGQFWRFGIQRYITVKSGVYRQLNAIGD